MNSFEQFNKKRLYTNIPKITQVDGKPLSFKLENIFEGIGSYLGVVVNALFTQISRKFGNEQASAIISIGGNLTAYVNLPSFTIDTITDINGTPDCVEKVNSGNLAFTVEAYEKDGNTYYKPIWHDLTEEKIKIADASKNFELAAKNSVNRLGQPYKAYIPILAGAKKGGNDNGEDF